MGRGPRKRKAQQNADSEGATPDAAEAAAASTRSLVATEADVASKRQRRSKGTPSNDEPVRDAKDAADRLDKWASDPERVDKWMGSRGGGLEQPLLMRAGKILRLRDYMPIMIADSVLKILESLPEDAWERSKQGGDEDAARHRFWSADVMDVTDLSPLRHVFWQMLKSFRGEPTLPIFSAGCYCGSDFIGRHDDRAFVPFFGDGKFFSRTVAAIWYLTRDWSADNGGCLVDLQAAKDDPDRNLVPIYNSLVVFEVPHMHEVTAVLANRPRYSIFGWWHQKGERYDLPGPSPLSQEQLLSTKKRRSKRKTKRESGGESAAVAKASNDAVPVASDSKKPKKKVKRKKLGKPIEDTGA